jgi:hypothetical protein
MQAYPLLALNGHRFARRQCLLLGVKQTWRLHCEMSAFDPKRTSGNPAYPASRFRRGQVGACVIDM